MRSIEMTGKTVEDAVKAGLKELGCDSSDVRIDVLHMGSPGLFGMFGRLAKVRLTVKEEDPALDFDLSDISLSLSKPAKTAPKAKTEKKPAPVVEAPAAQPAPVEESAPAAEVPAAEAPAAEAPAAAPVEEAAPVVEAPAVETPAAAPAPKTKTEKSARSDRAPRQNKGEGKNRPAKGDERKGEKSAKPAPKAKTEAAPAEPFEPSDPETLGEAGRAAYDFLKNVTEKMGVQVAIRVTENEDGIAVSMMGDTLGILIGRRGDTLDALQYLTSLHVNKHRDAYLRVSLDTENYRQKREEALTKLAMRMASRARKTGKKVTLEPMNPYERRILHSALQNNPYVTTHSEGEEPYRRVIITLKQDAE